MNCTTYGGYKNEVYMPTKIFQKPSVRGKLR
jgi:hypothetical protein